MQNDGDDCPVYDQQTNQGQFGNDFFAAPQDRPREHEIKRLSRIINPATNKIEIEKADVYLGNFEIDKERLNKLMKVEQRFKKYNNYK